MTIIDPRLGDIEDDRSGTKKRSMLSLAGNLLAEVSLPKLIAACILLIVLPGLMLGAAPLIASIWIVSVSAKLSALLSGIWPILLLSGFAVVGWFGGRPLFRVAESSFWSLNALVVQPGYALLRETFRHVVESLLSAGASDATVASVRAALAAGAGLAMGAIGLSAAWLAWPATRWTAGLTDLGTPHQLVLPAVANAVVIIAVYLGLAGLIWGVADAVTPQPGDLRSFHRSRADGRRWRIAHLSDLHVVGEQYGFRIESGRAGVRGNERLRSVLARLDAIHAAQPLDAVIVTGDLTDAGRSTEWAELFDALTQYPALSGLIVALPGNHDVNVIDRANPARLELPTGPKKRLRQLRTLSALEAIQGSRVLAVDRKTGRLGVSLSDALKPHIDEIRTFADSGRPRRPLALAKLWLSLFPMVRPPVSDDGLGIIALNSNAETHFSFTNALGLVSAEQVSALEIAVRQYPHASWIVALHHHPVEYPKPAKALSERIGTALVNGSWFVRKLQRMADHVVVMHGHRHVDWIGECGGLLIVSAPSPVMESVEGSDTYFYIHTLEADRDRRLRLLEPERIEVRDPGSVDC
ncbi:metallophosphoesterase [Methylobacterium durans]|uniref:metallophosphoesterase family protein n=1 Tax=Methylobacterium durans TaxID=2202825 RepID=UPI002AFDD025|nr:metallophosphoesterase [Methylobacterium durans]MEA1833076.1 metallophosphoesterase [Methylobacterium durans]